MLWLSGGPGCSSLLACFQENGPFIFKPEETKFTMNPNSWNNNANLLYLETPSGVGFSESGVKDKITDESTTQETL